MKTCPACRKTIDVQAVKCPYCQTAFDGMQMEVGRKESGRRRVRTALAAFVVLIAAAYWLTRPELAAELGRRDAQAEFNAKN